MKKSIYLFIFLLVLNIVIAQESIYEFIIAAKNSPADYTFVLSDGFSRTETIQLAAFSKDTLVRKTKMDDAIINQERKLIVIGNYNDNIMTKKLSGRFPLEEGEGFIKLLNGNLIIAGAAAAENTELLKIIKDYEKNKNLLSSDEYIMGDFVLTLTVKEEPKVEQPSPEPTITEEETPEKSLLIWIIIAGILVGTTSSFFIIKKKKQHNRIKNYIMQNLQTGYTKEQIQQALLQQGWPEKTVENILNKVNIQ